MKSKSIVFVLITLLLFNPLPVIAAPLDITGGINNEYEYSEVIFISGEPIKMVGTYTVSERIRGNEKTLNYRFTLASENPLHNAKLDRRVSYTTTYNVRSDKGQTIADTVASSMRETINIGSDRYILDDHQFSLSTVIDNRPAADFYSGTLKARKVYDVNRGQGRTIIEISGGNVGYENFWGNTETQILDYIISFQPRNGNTEQESWQGSVKISTSDSMNKTIRYSDNEATYSSFDGGYMRIINQEMVSKYDYNMPRFTEGELNNNSRNRGIIELNKSMMPKVERLIIPKFRDIGGHWAEDNIKMLYSLDIFKDDSQFFLPNIPMKRLEFTKAVMRACDINIQPVQTTRVSRNTPAEVSPFIDLPATHNDYIYVKEALNRGIISGVSNDRFMPEAHLTRAQAIAILIRVLGFEHKAPTPGYYTSFSDDAQIPYWAKDSIYVAQEIGLINGDSFNRVNANQVMTRAESSAMLIRFLDFLERDLQRDYRENIMLFY